MSYNLIWSDIRVFSNATFCCLSVMEKGYSAVLNDVRVSLDIELLDIFRSGSFINHQLIMLCCQCQVVIVPLYSRVFRIGAVHLHII